MKIEKLKALKKKVQNSDKEELEEIFEDIMIENKGKRARIKKAMKVDEEGNITKEKVWKSSNKGMVYPDDLKLYDAVIEIDSSPTLTYEEIKEKALFWIEKEIGTLKN